MSKIYHVEKKIIQKVQQTIEKHKMLKGVKKALIAFSSGPDSVCLLDILYTLYGKKIELHLVYINHGLRSKRALQAEEKTTKEFAVRYNLSHTILKVKVKNKKIGVEAAARKARYYALLKCMKKIDAQCIALGHNLDDVVETFFMNVIRGSGTRGLQSIPPMRPPFIRPLIDVKKDEIRRFLKTRNLSFSVDETNKQLHYRRNLLRYKIIPQLTKINPLIHKTIKREIEILKQDDSYLENLTEKAYRNTAVREKNYIILDLKKIMRYNPSIRSRILMKAIKELRGDLHGYESKHLDEIIDLKNKESGKRYVLPKGFYARREYGNIVIGSSKRTKSIKRRITTEGEVLIPGNMILRTRIVSRFDLKNKKSDCEIFDLDRIKPPLYIRNRKAGDYIETKIGTKKIKKIFTEFKIPLHRRDGIMMLCDRNGILWVVGIMRAFRGYIDNTAKKILVVDFEYID